MPRPRVVGVGGLDRRLLSGDRRREAGRTDRGVGHARGGLFRSIHDRGHRPAPQGAGIGLLLGGEDRIHEQ